MKLQTPHMRQSGFTLLELLIIIGMMAILLGVITFNLASAQRSANLATDTETLEADMKNQQLNAMNGKSMTSITGDQYGIYVLPSQKYTYLLFNGTWNASNTCTTNYCVSFDKSISINVPAANNPIIFAQQSGEIGTGFSFTISNALGESKTITLNAHGVVTSIH